MALLPSGTVLALTVGKDMSDESEHDPISKMEQTENFKVFKGVTAVALGMIA